MVGGLPEMVVVIECDGRRGDSVGGRRSGASRRERTPDSEWRSGPGWTPTRHGGPRRDRGSTSTSFPPSLSTSLNSSSGKVPPWDRDRGSRPDGLPGETSYSRHCE